jgi:hypothetical protein
MRNAKCEMGIANCGLRNTNTDLVENLEICTPRLNTLALIEAQNSQFAIRNPQFPCRNSYENQHA